MALIIGHRTCPVEAPENSLEGIAAAATLGADGVEVDVRLTRDDVPVLMHDRTGWRTCRWPLPIRWTSSRRFARLRFRRDRSSGPPTFAEALRALPAGLVMAVDTKDPRAAAPVAEEVRRQRAEARVLLWAQSMDAVRTYRQALPGVEAALLRDTRTPVEHRRYLEDAVAVGAGAVSLHQDAAVPEVIDAARARGLTVYCWLQTLAKHEERRHARLDGVVTDWPVKARELFGRAGSPGPSGG